MNKLVLLDGMSLAYRAFYGLKANLTNKDGLHTNAIYGFATMLNKIIEDEKPSHLLVAFDAGKITFRHKGYEEYKAGRPPMPGEFSEQLPYIKQMIELRGIRMCEIPLYEADDIIGSYVKEAEKDFSEIVVISGDRDLLQLVSEKTTVSMTNMKKGPQLIPYTPEVLLEEKGITPNQVVDLKGFMGDTSDNIPGVPGVGEKTALKLLLEYKTMDNVYEHIPTMKKTKLVEKLVEFKEQAYMSKDLAQIYTDISLPIAFSLLVYDKEPSEQLIQFYREMEMKSFLKQLDITSEGKLQQTSLPECSFSLGDDTNVINIINATDCYMYVESLDDNVHTCDILGIGISTNSGDTFYWSMEQLVSNNDLCLWLANPNKNKIVFDVKRCKLIFERFNLKLEGVSSDILLAMYVLDPSVKWDSMATIGDKYSQNFVHTDDEFFGKGKSRTIPDLSEVREHICRKATIMRNVFPKIKADLIENEQINLIEEVELPLALVLSEVERVGIKVDSEMLQKMGTNFLEKIKDIEKEIHQLAGRQFTISSPKQLGIILFEDLQLPHSKKTKTGYSTSIDVLEGLLPEHPIIEKIILYRQLSKLNSTYVDGLLKLVHDDGKIHTHFNQVIAQTGRLSSVEPNLQNIPIRLEEGRKIREAFIPEFPEWIIVAADYSQIELRVLAHLAQDEILINAFQNGLDIHTNTAMNVFEVAEEDVTAEMRRRAKAINFGIVYGMSDFGLAQNLGIFRNEAKSFIERYFQMFPSVKNYLEKAIETAKNKGYVTTISNRRRYIPDINSSNFHLRSFAERVAMNTPVQGSAADIIKIAMIKIYKRLCDEKMQARILLQVHDELVFEAPESEFLKLEKVISEEMERVIPLSVPLEVNISRGNSWYEAK